MKIRVKHTDHKTHPIHVWHPQGRGESFEELTIEDAKNLRYQLNQAITKAESPGHDYECLICDPPVRFNTKDGPDRRHMTREHGLNLAWALKDGNARRIEE